jgi:hypothetical protein
MGTNVAGSWQKAVKLLQDIQLLQDCTAKEADREKAVAALEKLVDLVYKLEHLPTPPKAVWKKLLQQQVC